jgi:phage gpG-like protein
MYKPENLLKNILSDIRVELTDEFDRNFERKAFFDKPWPKRKHDFRGSLLVVKGRMRRSLRGSVSRYSVLWRSDTPYFDIHNRGGKIPVTPKMKKYFWARYYELGGKVTKLKSGKVSTSKRNTAISAEAQFYKNMALTKKTTITIPQRQSVGNHPRVKGIVRDIATNQIRKFCADLAKTMRQ